MIAIAFALEFESACFRARHDPRLRVGVWLLGAMGAGAATSLRRKLNTSVPALLISAGFACGLQPGLKAGDLVLSRTTPIRTSFQSFLWTNDGMLAV